MRVLFAGTPAFAATALEALAAAGHDIALVLTQPDRPAGRGLRLTASAVSDLAQRLGFEVQKPASLKPAEAVARLKQVRPEVMVVAAYGLLLPKAVLDIPPRGCLNIHASLLPRWRGAAPVQRALLAGDGLTGISIMRMEEGLDTGPVLLAKEMPIAPRDTAGSLTAKLAELGARAIVEALAALDTLVPHPQDAAAATYAAKVTKAEARIDWAQPCATLDRQVRAFNPSPGAEALLGGEALKIWEAEPIEGASGAAGEILAGAPEELVVGCGRGALRVQLLQRPGGRRMSAADFLRGKGLRAGPAQTPR